METHIHFHANAFFKCEDAINVMSVTMRINIILSKDGFQTREFGWFGSREI